MSDLVIINFAKEATLSPSLVCLSARRVWWNLTKRCDVCQQQTITFWSWSGIQELKKKHFALIRALALPLTVTLNMHARTRISFAPKRVSGGDGMSLKIFFENEWNICHRAAYIHLYPQLLSQHIIRQKVTAVSIRGTKRLPHYLCTVPTRTTVYHFTAGRPCIIA